MRRTLCALGILSAIATAAAGPVHAADAYPSRPVRLIVSYPPGGTNDILARILAKKLTQATGANFFVENRIGANGVIGTNTVAKAAPDGYTLLVASSAPLAVGPTLFPNVPYNALHDFAPISLIADVDVVLVARHDFPANDYAGFIKYAAAHPGKVNVALGGFGSVAQMLIEDVSRQNHLTLTKVPYTGTGPALVDLLAGRVDVDFENLPATISYIKSGQLTPIVSFSKTRSEQLPNVPTVGELGAPSLSAAPWFAIVAPAGTSDAIQQKLAATIKTVLSDPQTKAQFAALGANVKTSSPEQTTKYVADEYHRWARLIQDAHITMK